jgi:hypothetical protein
MHVKPSEERLIFESGIILTDGFYYGQSNFLSLTQFIGVAQIYNYFQDYELPYSDGIVEPEDFIRAVQDANMPPIYNSLVVNKLFIDMEGMDFFSLCQTIWSYRMYTLPHGVDMDITPGDHSMGPKVTMSFPRFEAIVNLLPKGVQNLIKTSMVPSVEEIEKASA